MANEQRDVKVKLTVDLGPEGNRAMRELSESAKAAGAAIKTSMAGGAAAGPFAGMRPNTPGITGPGGSGGGGFGSGMPGGLPGLGGIAKGLAGMAAVNTALGITRVGNDAFTTQGQKARGILGQIPGGSKVLEIADTLSGRAAGMEVAKYNAAFMGIEGQRMGEQAAFGLTYNPAQAGRAELARQYAGGSALALPNGARDTFAGERAFREESRLYPLRVQAAKAEREAAAAAKERTAAEAELVKLSRTETTLAQERSKLEKQLAANGSGVSRERVLGDIANNERQRMANAATMRQAAQQRMDAVNRESQAGAEVSRAQAGQLGVRAENLEERANNAASAAGRLGAMNPLERAKALNDFRIFMQNGGEGVPQSVIEGAMRYDPATVQKVLEKVGAASGEYQAGAEYGASFGAESPEALRKQAGELRQQQANKEYDTEKQITQTAADAGREFGKLTREVIDRMFTEMKRQLLTDLLISKNSA